MSSDSVGANENQFTRVKRRKSKSNSNKTFGHNETRSLKGIEKASSNAALSRSVHLRTNNNDEKKTSSNVARQLRNTLARGPEAIRITHAHIHRDDDASAISLRQIRACHLATSSIRIRESHPLSLFSPSTLHNALSSPTLFLQDQHRHNLQHKGALGYTTHVTYT